jgi:hypothetical protein
MYQRLFRDMLSTTQDQNCDRDNGDAFSAAVNKFVEDHGLRESERHTLYSLRHGLYSLRRCARPKRRTN